MSTRVHLVLGEEEKALLEQAARREGMTLSAWLREAAAERLKRNPPPSLSSVADLEAFFRDGVVTQALIFQPLIDFTQCFLADHA